MGSGTYHDTVQVQVCTDSQCANQIQGSPISVKVSYTVTGNSVSNATYEILPTSLYFEAPTNGSVAAQTIAVTAYELPSYGAYVSLSSQSGGPVLNLSFAQTTANAEPYAYGTGTLTVTMKPPLSLGPGTYTDMVSLSICYDQACTKQAPQSPFQIPVTYLVTASAGQEFTQQTVSQNASALAVNPAGTLLYATTNACSLTSGCSTPAQLISIDPTSGTVTTLIASLTAPATQILVSRDGAYLYLLANATVSRVNTTTWTIDQTVQLAPNTYTPSEIALSPTTSTTWAASFSAVTGTAANSELQIFDGSTARPDILSQSNSGSIGLGIVWSADGSTMYVTDPLFNLSAVPVTASGVGTPAALQTASAFYAANLQLAGGLLYADSGQVLNPSTNTLVGQYPFPTGTPGAGMTVDPANDRVFAAYNQSMPNGVVATIESYNLSAFSELWVARLPIGTAPVRWGSQGLAWIGPSSTQGESQVYIISGVFVAP
jgi:hypothetical protein